MAARPKIIYPCWLYSFEVPENTERDPTFEKMVGKTGDIFEPEIINMRFTGWLVNPAHPNKTIKIWHNYWGSPCLDPKSPIKWKRTLQPIQSMFTIGAFARTGVQLLLHRASVWLTNRLMKKHGVKVKITEWGNYEYD